MRNDVLIRETVREVAFAFTQMDGYDERNGTDLCDITSCFLQFFLLQQGISSDICCRSGDGEQCHCWVNVAGYILDLTAIQFEEFPANPEQKYIFENTKWHDDNFPNLGKCSCSVSLEGIIRGSADYRYIFLSICQALKVDMCTTELRD